MSVEPQIVELRVTLGQTASMPSPDAAARHTGAGVARRPAHHERMRDERAREAAAGTASHTLRLDIEFDH